MSTHDTPTNRYGCQESNGIFSEKEGVGCLQGFEEVIVDALHHLLLGTFFEGNVLMPLVMFFMLVLMQFTFLHMISGEENLPHWASTYSVVTLLLGFVATIAALVLNLWVPNVADIAAKFAIIALLCTALLLTVFALYLRADANRASREKSAEDA